MCTRLSLFLMLTLVYLVACSDTPISQLPLDKVSGDVFHIHEDDWGMRSLHPHSYLQEARQEIAHSKANAENNCDEFGCAEIYGFSFPETDFSQLGYSQKTVTEVFGSDFPRVRNFYATATSGFSSNQRDKWSEYLHDAFAFGKNSGCFIKFDIEDKKVRGMWFEHEKCEESSLLSLKNALNELNKISPLIIVDMWTNEVIDLNDKQQVNLYGID